MNGRQVEGNRTKESTVCNIDQRAIWVWYGGTSVYKEYCKPCSFYDPLGADITINIYLFICYNYCRCIRMYVQNIIAFADHHHLNCLTLSNPLGLEVAGIFIIFFIVYTSLRRY